jgi:hypothetical protein
MRETCTIFVNFFFVVFCQIWTNKVETSLLQPKITDGRLVIPIPGPSDPKFSNGMNDLPQQAFPNGDLQIPGQYATYDVMDAGEFSACAAIGP